MHALVCDEKYFSFETVPYDHPNVSGSSPSVLYRILAV
jgi:hypothetical protein